MEIDVSTKKGLKQYYKTLTHQQAINEQLGYSKEPWSKKKYEKSRKILEKPL